MARKICLCYCSAKKWSVCNGILTLGGIKEFPDEGPDYWHDYYKSIFVMSRCMPFPEDFPEQFSQLVADYDISKERLIKLAFYAPQWKPFIAHVIGNDHYIIAVDWLSNIRDPASINTSELSMLCKSLGEELWDMLVRASRLAYWEQQRLTIYKDAILGRFRQEELIEKFNSAIPNNLLLSRTYIVAYALMPLLPDPNRYSDIVRRYQFIKSYMYQSKQFGNKRRTANQRAGSEAIKNLANNAGYSDVKIFELVIETAAVQDLAKGPVTVEVDGYELTFSLTGSGNPELTIGKNDKFLRSMPQKLKNDKIVIDLKHRLKEIKRQRSWMRSFLEQAMSNSTEYSSYEFLMLMSNPILKMLMQLLIFVCEKGMGYPIGTTLRLSSLDGREIIVGEDDHLRIAHPYDLMRSGAWDKWQHDCFLSGRIQPFKQVFRELYIVTGAEINEEHELNRYSGVNVNLSKLLTSSSREDGTIMMIMVLLWELKKMYAVVPLTHRYCYPILRKVWIH